MHDTNQDFCLKRNNGFANSVIVVIKAAGFRAIRFMPKIFLFHLKKKKKGGEGALRIEQFNAASTFELWSKIKNDENWRAFNKRFLDLWANDKQRFQWFLQFFFFFMLFKPRNGFFFPAKLSFFKLGNSVSVSSLNNKFMQKAFETRFRKNNCYNFFFIWP